MEKGPSNQDAYTFNYWDVILGDPPIMYWGLGETAGPFAYDESVNRPDATYIGNPSFELPGAIADDSNSSVEFNGINRYVEWDPILAFPACPILVGAHLLWCVYGRGVGQGEESPRADTFLTASTGGAKFSFDFKFDTFTTDAIQKFIYFDMGDGTPVAIG